MRSNTLTKYRRYRGSMLLELGFAMATTGILLAVLVISLDGFGRFNHYQLACQRCTAAGLAQLDSMTATGRALDDAQIEELWPGVACEVSTSAGEGMWKGLTRVDVTATAQSKNRTVTLQQRRYIADMNNDL